MANLESALNDREIRHGTADILRALFAREVLIPDAKAPDGLWAEMHGEVAEIPAMAEHVAAALANKRACVSVCNFGSDAILVDLTQSV